MHDRYALAPEAHMLKPDLLDAIVKALLVVAGVLAVLWVAGVVT